MVTPQSMLTTFSNICNRMRDAYKVYKFKQYVYDVCDYNGVNVIFDPNDRITDENGCMYSGYFYGEPEAYQGELAVAVGVEMERWLPILVHEFGHCLQWIEDSPFWYITYFEDEDFDAYESLSLWTMGEKDLAPSQAQQFAKLVRMLEHDCDQRAVQLIEQFDLPIDKQQYIQQSNAYHLYFNYVGKTGNWSYHQPRPYVDEAVWGHMPTQWLDDYDYPPQHLIDLLFEKYGH